MKRRRNIAVFLSNWNQESQVKNLRGIWKSAKEKNCNVSVFTCQGGIDLSRKYDVGEYAIYDLANVKRFDGIILAGNTIMAKTVKDKLCQRIRESKVPAISLEEQVEGLLFVGIDNYISMKQMIEHLRKEHSYRRISYISGPVDNYESRQRLQAYLDIREEYKLDGMVWYGDYTFGSGQRIMTEILQNETTLPEAIVCANDNMAMGVCHTLKDNGLKVPFDIAVTGFDNNYDAAHYSPGISSVERPKVDLGYQACEILIDIFDGNCNKELVMNTTLAIRRSCGCNDNSLIAHDEYRRIVWQKQQTFRNQANYRDMNEEMLEYDNFKEIFLCIKRNTDRFINEEVTICLNRVALQNMEPNLDWDRISSASKYEEELYIPHYNEASNKIDYTIYSIEDVFPGLWDEDRESNLYIFTPLHFKDSCFGLIVLCGSLEPLAQPYYFTWIHNISNVLEELQNISLLNKALSELNKALAEIKESSIRDPLTGLHNRAAIHKFLPKMLEKARAHKYNLLYCFIDMDKLKVLNDVYGHNVGDQAILTVTKVLKEAFCGNEIIIRFGGDEFLIVAEDGSVKWIQEKERYICSRLEDLSKELNFPFPVAISMGCHIDKEHVEESVEHCIKLADDRMYVAKSRKRKNTLYS